MINKTAGKALLLSVAAFSVMMTGCGSNKATEAYIRRRRASSAA